MEKLEKFWTTIQPAIYNVEPGWEEAFAKFTAGEAPMMVGYATSDIWFAQDDSQKIDMQVLFGRRKLSICRKCCFGCQKEVKAGAKNLWKLYWERNFKR